MTEENYTPDESKKQPLFEIFRAVVWADLVDGAELKAASEAGIKAGVTDKDLDALDRWDAKQCRKYFGEAAISRDLVNAMKASDRLGGGLAYKKAGFYS